MNWQKEFYIKKNIHLGTEVNLELSVVAHANGEVVYSVNKICECVKEALEFSEAFQSLIKEERFMLNVIVVNFACSFLGIDKKGKSLNQVASEINLGVKKQKEELGI